MTQQPSQCPPGGTPQRIAVIDYGPPPGGRRWWAGYYRYSVTTLPEAEREVQHGRALRIVNTLPLASHEAAAKLAGLLNDGDAKRHIS